jgi:hypothetical protein
MTASYCSLKGLTTCATLNVRVCCPFCIHCYCTSLLILLQTPSTPMPSRFLPLFWIFSTLLVHYGSSHNAPTSLRVRLECAQPLQPGCSGFPRTARGTMYHIPFPSQALSPQDNIRRRRYFPSLGRRCFPTRGLRLLCFRFPTGIIRGRPDLFSFVALSHTRLLVSPSREHERMRWGRIVKLQSLDSVSVR